MTAKKFYIIDGPAYVFRSFYAMPYMSSPGGVPTNAIFGFLKTLNGLIATHRPDYLVVAFDPGGKNFRHEIFPDYKANRGEIPDELKAQLPLCIEAVKKLGITTMVQTGFEADDLIGTLAHQASAAGCDVTVISEDKDLLQLITENVSVFKAAKREKVDLAGLLEKTQLTPEQFIDYLALAGDSADNIPGVKGVGPKTATTLLLEYKDFDGIYANVEEITRKKLKENLINCEKAARMSLELVKIDCDMDIDFSLDACALKLGDRQEALDFFTQYGLKNLPGLTSSSLTGSAGDQAGGIKTSAGAGKAETSDSVEVELTLINGDYKVCQTEAQVDEGLKSLSGAKAWVVDLETTGLVVPGAQVVGVAFCAEAKKAFYVPIMGPAGEWVMDWEVFCKKTKTLFSDSSTLKIGQNIKYDLKVLRSAGVEVAGPVFDTMIGAYLVSPGSRRYNIDDLTRNILGFDKTPTEAIIGKGKKMVTMDTIAVATVGHYACEDVDATWRLYEALLPRLKEAKLEALFTDLEMPLVRALVDIEYAGIGLDVALLAAMSEDLTQCIDGLEKDIWAQAGEEFNVKSPKQLGVILFEKMGIKPPKKTKSGYSTDVDVLTKLSRFHELPALVLEYRSYAKLQSTYVEALPRLINEQTKKLHTSFVQTGTETGRLSSRDPNLQNIPVRSELGKSIRRAFVPSPGKVLIAADYSQIELRILAHYCKDQQLLDAFNADQDVHCMVASQIYGVDVDKVDDEMRSNAKAINFGILYGQSAFGLSQDTDLSMEEAKEFIDSYFKYFSGVREFIDSTIEQARIDGRVWTMGGRYRDLPDINATRVHVRQFAERTAVNTVIQGSAADLIKRAMVDFHQLQVEEKTSARMLIQIHDELVLEADEASAEADSEHVRRVMENAWELAVPLKVSLNTGANWMDIK